MGIQMKRKKPQTMMIYDDFKLKGTFGLHGLYKNIQRFKELTFQLYFFNNLLS